MKKLTLVPVVVCLALGAPVAYAQPVLEQRVAALETTVSDLQARLDMLDGFEGLEAIVYDLETRLDDLAGLLGEDSVGNLQLQEDIELGDADTSGELLVRHRNGAPLFTVTGNDCSGCHWAADTGMVVVGNSEDPMDVDFAIKSSSTGENALYFDSRTQSLDIGRGLRLAGSTGDTSQPITANGFVKAWAVLGNNGAFVKGYNATGSRRRDEGFYEIDFTIGDLINRPMLATSHIGGKYIEASHVIVSVNGRNTTDAFVLTLGDRHKRVDIGRLDSVCVVVF